MRDGFRADAATGALLFERRLAHDVVNAATLLVGDSVLFLLRFFSASEILPESSHFSRFFEEGRCPRQSLRHAVH